MAGARIQSYAFSEGPATGAAAKYQRVQTLGVIEQATGTTTYSRPLVPTLWDDLLTGWATALTTACPGNYTVTYSQTTQRVTIASTNATSFRPVLVGAAAAFLGFTQVLGSGWATSWTGASAPLGVVELAGVTVKPAEDGAKVALAHYRHGRAIGVGWGNVLVHKVTVWIRQADAAHLTAGWTLTGRVRIWQDGTHLTAYGATNVGGYVDGYVVNASGLRAYGASEDFLTMDLTIATAR